MDDLTSMNAMLHGLQAARKAGKFASSSLRTMLRNIEISSTNTDAIYKDIKLAGIYALSSSIKDAADGIHILMSTQEAVTERLKLLIDEIENLATSVDALYKVIYRIYEKLAWSFKYVIAAFNDIEVIATEDKATFTESQNVFIRLIFKLSMDIKEVTAGLDTLSSGLGGMQAGYQEIVAGISYIREASTNLPEMVNSTYNYMNIASETMENVIKTLEYVFEIENPPSEESALSALECAKMQDVHFDEAIFEALEDDSNIEAVEFDEAILPALEDISKTETAPFDELDAAFEENFETETVPLDEDVLAALRGCSETENAMLDEAVLEALKTKNASLCKGITYEEIKILSLKIDLLSTSFNNVKNCLSSMYLGMKRINNGIKNTHTFFKSIKETVKDIAESMESVSAAFEFFIKNYK